MLLSPWKNFLDSLFKEVRAFRALLARRFLEMLLNKLNRDMFKPIRSHRGLPG